jgi:serine/threonine protein kinase/tetratricopeptide (TPR) repeat protein
MRRARRRFRRNLMKTIAPGLSDSIASVLADPRPCPHCDSSSHIAGGLCVGCLLEAGLDPEDEGDSESLVGILAEINLPDQNWRLGNYEILEEIGRGGMGVIYRARQRHSRRIVAVKRVLSYHSDSRETLARFRREAQAAASLDHPNILPIYEVSESEDGLPFFSMKFAPGGTLQQVAPALRTEPRQCVALVAKIARAVQYAHGHGILHRDLKPGNILLDGRGEPLVSDFGLAKWLDTTSDLTRTLTIFGTPGYIAPEQASSAAAELKPTADIYSLGAILFDLLAGRPPFLGAHALSVIRQAAELPAPKLRSLSKIADRDLETICSRCLEREPSARYHSAHDLAEDLERWLEGRPIIARPVSSAVRFWRWSRRNPALAGSIGICATLAFVAVAGLTMSSRLGGVVRNETMARRTISVIPFEDLDVLSIDSPAAEEITRSLGSEFARSDGIQFRSYQHPKTEDALPWKPEDWRKLGQSLAVRFLVTGTVRQREAQQRIVVRVLDVPSGIVTWTKVIELDRTKTGLDSLLKDAAVDLKQILQAATSGRTPVERIVSNNATARQYLEAGREYFSRYRQEDTNTAITYFEKAIAADPECASAQAMYALAAVTQARQSSQNDREAWISRAETAATKAVQLDPNLALTHRALSVCHTLRGRSKEALESSLKAIELDSTDILPLGSIAYTLRQAGRPDLAIRWFRRCAARAQRPGIYSAAIGDSFFDLGEYGMAEQAYKEASEFCPDLPDGIIGLAHLRLAQKDFNTARKLSQEATKAFPQHPYPIAMLAQVEMFSGSFSSAADLYSQLVERDRFGGNTFYAGVSYLSGVALSFSRTGRVEDAAQLTNELIVEREKELVTAPHNPSLHYDLAASYCLSGQSEKSLEFLRSAIENGWIDHQSAASDPRFTLLRRNSHFQEMLQSRANYTDDLRRQRPADTLASTP